MAHLISLIHQQERRSSSGDVCGCVLFPLLHGVCYAVRIPSAWLVVKRGTYTAYLVEGDS